MGKYIRRLKSKTESELTGFASPEAALGKERLIVLIRNALDAVSQTAQPDFSTPVLKREFIDPLTAAADEFMIGYPGRTAADIIGPIVDEVAAANNISDSVKLSLLIQLGIKKDLS